MSDKEETMTEEDIQTDSEIESVNNPERHLEALLFAAKKPLSIMDLEERMPKGTDVRALLRTLKTAYETRGIQLVERENNWAFRTAADLKVRHHADAGHQPVSAMDLLEILP
jgi:segregation and condensation protein B